MGLIPVSQTLICRIASPLATAGEGFSLTCGSIDCRFIQPDLSRQPETPQIVMLSDYRSARTSAFRTWREVTGVAAA